MNPNKNEHISIHSFVDFIKVKIRSLFFLFLEFWFQLKKQQQDIFPSSKNI